MAGLLEVVTEATVAAVINRDLARTAVHRAFVSAWRDDVGRFPVLAGAGAAQDTAVNIKFGHCGPMGPLGLKVGTFWPSNEEIGLANHGATTLLLDPRTGAPRALVAASLLNRFRTAAADAVAVDALARTDASILAIVGTGRQAAFEARAIADVRQLSEIRIGGRNRDSAERLCDELRELAPIVRAAPTEIALRDADIVVTITASREPVIKARWLAPNAHISAMGADRKGKRELDSELADTAFFVADDPGQSAVVGEGQHRTHPETIVAIGSLLAQLPTARPSAAALTVFDSSGLAIQDLFVADAVLDAARSLGLVDVLEF